MRGLALVGAVAIAGCDDVDEHIFTAHLYETQNACLDPSTAIDVVKGASTGNGCAPVCLTSGSNVYVSTQCPPYPPDYTAESMPDAGDATLGDDAGGAGDPCVPAFQAYASGVYCAADGGPPEAGGADVASESSGDDGGGEGGGGDDGSGDAPGDVQLDSPPDAAAGG